MHKEIKNFIFDLDGTLIDSSEEILLCLKKAFNKAEYSINYNLFTPDIIGPPIDQIIKNIAPDLIDEEIISNIIKNFRLFYDNDDKDISIMYEGIFEYLNLLKSQNKNLYIATCKPKIPTERLIHKFKLNNLFDDIYTIDKFNKPMNKTQMIKDIIKKYNLHQEETVMVGDSISDILAAKNNQIIGIGVLWGYDEAKQDLIDMADYSINNIKEQECLKLN